MAEGDGYTIRGRDELEQMEGSGECKWALVRKSLGLGAFGINMVEIGPGGQIPEHDESDRDHEELFIIGEGHATAVLDGDESPAPPGTYVRVSPEVRRTIRNDGEVPVKMLIVSAPRSSGYEPMGWG